MKAQIDMLKKDLRPAYKSPRFASDEVRRKESELKLALRKERLIGSYSYTYNGSKRVIRTQNSFILKLQRGVDVIKLWAWRMVKGFGLGG